MKKYLGGSSLSSPGMVLNLVQYIYEESNLDLKLIALPPIKATRIKNKWRTRRTMGGRKKISYPRL